MGHFASTFFHVPPFSESKLFILCDDYLGLKKYLLKRLLSKSVQAWSLSKSKAWVEAYNGLKSLEEAALFHSLSPYPVIFVILVNTHLYDKELT